MFAAAPAKADFLILFEHRPGYLYVSVSGAENNYRVARAYWQRIVAMIHHRRYERVMVDKYFTGTLPAGDAYRLLTELAHSRCHARIAIVDRSFNVEHAKFEELVGTNRGLQIKFLYEIGAAERWLGVKSSVVNADGEKERPRQPSAPGLQ